jgi:hypothetical protein
MCASLLSKCLRATRVFKLCFVRAWAGLSDFDHSCTSLSATLPVPKERYRSGTPEHVGEGDNLGDNAEPA